MGEGRSLRLEGEPMGEGRSLRLEEGTTDFRPSSLVYLPSQRLSAFVKILCGLSGLGEYFEIWAFTSITG